MVLAGFAVGTPYATAEGPFGRGAALVVVGIAVLAVLVAEIRHHRRQPSSNVSS